MQIPDSPECQIEVSGLWKVFGDKPEQALDPAFSSYTRTQIQEELGLVVGLRDISFNVEVGETFVIMGLSGSGKSTLVRCLTRLIEATEGSILFDGENILEYTQGQLTEFRRAKVSMVFQSYGLLPHRTVMDNVAFGLEIRGIDKSERYRLASNAIETVGLDGWEDYFPREMSGGMQQRVGLARALAVDSPVLLMDEPFSGLDPLIRREMQDELITLQTELHKTIVFITHDLDEALKLGDTIVVLRDGEIAQKGSPQEIVSSPADEYVSEFVKDVSRAKVIRAEAIMREVVCAVRLSQSPREALDAMESAEVAVAFAVNDGGALIGALSRRAVATMASDGEPDMIGASPRPIPSVGMDAYLEEIVPLASRSEQPIAVVDGDGILKGEVPRGALLAGISAESQEA